MIDRITRRAAAISLGSHAALVLCTLIAFGPGLPSPPQVPPPPAVPATPPPPPAAAPLLVPAEDRIEASPPAPLPALAAADQPGPPIIRHRPTDRMDGAHSRGRGGEAGAAATLPAASGDQATTLATLQGRTSNVRLDDELARLTTARQVLELMARQRYRTQWSAYALRITRRSLVVWIEVDRRGVILRGGLFRCSSGVAEVDAGIERWLNGGDGREGDRIGLPSLPVGRIHYLELSLP